MFVKVKYSKNVNIYIKYTKRNKIEFSVIDSKENITIIDFHSRKILIIDK